MLREEMVERLRAGGTWDLVVIGGGATGLGTALDAVARGYRTLLLEAYDFAQGTSSRSTKLIHGGVRYLASGQVGLVREALHERGLLLRNAPHLVHARSFLVPSYGWGTAPYYALGLKLYDLMAGARRLGWSQVVGRDEALRRAPTLRREGLRGGVVYQDGQFDDARLAIALARTIADQGGTALNYVKTMGLIKEAGLVRGVLAQDTETGEEFAIRARVVVNATGVFADEVRQLDEPGAVRLIRLSRGAHLVLDRCFLPGTTAVLVPKTEDGRVLFAIPWQGRVLLGTTDTPTDRAPLEPRATPEEVAYLLRHAGRYLDPAPQADAVRSVFAGLRPLVDTGSHKGTAQLSREHAVLVSRSGLVTIIGGKWTTYRRMAADAVDQAAVVGDLARRPCATASLRLHGWTDAPLCEEDALAVYGSEAEAVRRLLAERPEWNALLHPAFPYRAGEVVWAARWEWARTVVDVLARRLRALFLDAQAASACVPRVAALLAAELNRDAVWEAEQARRFDELIRVYTLS